jgi:hypothetical protein
MPYTTINKGSSYFNTVLYTGDDTTSRSITGVGFKPDFTWIKSRSNAYYHELYDAVRGFSSTTNGKVLYSNVASAEGTPNTFNSFNTDGFTVSKQTGETGTNGTGSTYVAWNWLGANTTVSNTSGTITSTVSANTTSGFSVGTYTGNSTSDATIGHGLGVAPNMVIVKNRSGADNWQVYWNDGTERNGFLNLTNAFNTPASTSVWGNNNPTSSVFYVGNDSATNTSNNYVFYAFTSIKGYSKFGSYTGNGSADGTFIYTGFKPAYVGFKKSSAAGTNWVTSNNKVNTYNAVDAYLHQNTSGTESTGSRDIDFLSNGFKIRNSNSTWNESGATFIYMAFAENPFVTSGGIPVTAR